VLVKWLKLLNEIVSAGFHQLSNNRLVFLWFYIDYRRTGQIPARRSGRPRFGKATESIANPRNSP
jgi:hypothetical protein